MFDYAGTTVTGLAKPDDLLDALLTLRETIIDESEPMIARWTRELSDARQHFAPSLRNLAHYVALRRHDLRPLQEALRPWGVSSLERIEPQVLTHLDAIIATLSRLADYPEIFPRPTAADFEQGQTQLEHQSDALFGAAPSRRCVRMMVTLPAVAATDYALVRDFLNNGMNIARINTAQNTAHEWLAMVEQVRWAMSETRRGCKIAVELGGTPPRTGAIIQPDGHRLQTGDMILMTRETPRLFGSIRVSMQCSLPQAMEQVAVGDAVWFDDGKIGAQVTDKINHGVVLKVTHARSTGETLKYNRRIHFPETDLDLPLLTHHDQEALNFAAQHADIVIVSLVETAADVEHLHATLIDHHAHTMPGIILKLETKKAVANLPELIAAAGRNHPVGVMIARGDLAVEIGFERLAAIQDDILAIADAAQVPVIWATPALEALAKKGRPSRAEVTDTTMAERAECVILNSGAYILDAMRILDDSLVRMSAHQTKKVARLHALSRW